MNGAAGPAWVGIGAQRSGTTWLTDMLAQHPDISVVDRKELHAFDRAWVDAWTAEDTHAYRSRFEGMPGAAGEFTPYYLRAPWAPAVAKEACPDDTVFIAILRDPVDRYLSALRWEVGRRLGQPSKAPLGRAWIRRMIASDAAWGSSYAPQLEAWADVVGEERMLVLQYERARKDPTAAVTAIASRLGLAPFAPTDVATRSRTSTSGSLDVPSALLERLAAINRRDLDELSTRWGIDPSLWPATTRETVRPDGVTP